MSAYTSPHETRDFSLENSDCIALNLDSKENVTYIRDPAVKSENFEIASGAATEGQKW